MTITGGERFANPGAVLQATEHGSPLERFHASPGGRYWIDPTVTAEEARALVTFEAAVAGTVAAANAGRA